MEEKNREWRSCNNAKLTKKGGNMLDPSWVGTRVEYLAYYDIDEVGNEKELRLVGGKYWK